MKEYQSGLKAMMTVMPPETKKEDLVAKADEYKRFDVGMMRKLQEINMTPGQGIPKKLKENPQPFGQGFWFRTGTKVTSA
jgi:hypothetical protein